MLLYAVAWRDQLLSAHIGGYKLFSNRSALLDLSTAVMMNITDHPIVAFMNTMVRWDRDLN